MDRIGIALIGLYMAWRYAKIAIDPDWAMFNLEGFTGARYGRDFVDCKTPAIHWLYKLIGRIVGQDVVRVRFAYTALVSLPGVIIGGWTGLAYVVLIQSGWLLAFHGNVSQVPAGLILLALATSNPWVAAALVAVAVMFEPKLGPSGLAMYLINQWYAQAVVYFTVVLVALPWLSIPMLDWIWEANVTVAGRMTKMRYTLARQGHDFSVHASKGMVYILPWLVIGAMHNPNLLYWLPVLLYLVFIAIGLAVRANHFLAIVPWIAMALPPEYVLALAIVDWASAFGYWTGIWQRFYPGLASLNEDARSVGLWLKDKPGKLWVNGIHTGIYIYAGKPPIGGMCEQIEIRENAEERRLHWREVIKMDPPKWVVVGFQPGWTFKPIGYSAAAKTAHSVIYQGG